MQDKKYLIEIPGQEGVAYWGEDRYNANKDALLKDHPDAIIAEIDTYSADDANDNDMYLIDVPGQQGSAYWDANRFNANKDALLKDHPDAQIQRVRAVDYWGEQRADLERQMQEFDAAHGQFLNEYEARQKGETIAGIASGGYINPSNYLSDNLAEYNLRNQERETLRATYSNNPAVKAEREASLNAVKEFSSKMEEEWKQRYSDAIAKYRSEGGNIAAQGASSVIDNMAETQMYGAALKMLQEAQDTLEAPSKYDGSNGFVNFMKGAGHTFGSADFWTAGLTEIADNSKIRAAFERLAKKEGTTDISKLTEEQIDAALSPAEKAAVLAFTQKALADYKRSADLSLGYQSGQSAAESLGFMAQFLLTGAVTSAAAKGATSGMAKWLARNLGNAMVKKAAPGIAKLGARALQQTGKFALGTARSLIDAAVRTGLTTTLPRSISEQALPNVFEGTLPEANEYILKGLGDAFIENWSEAYGGVLSKMVSTPASAMFGEWGKVIARSPFMKGLERGGFNGYLSEIGEEWFGSAMRSLLNVDPDALKNFATVESQIITATSFLPMTLIGGAVSVGQYRAAGKNLENKATELRTALEKLGLNIEEIDALVDYRQQLSPKMLSERFAPIVNRLAKTGSMSNAVEVMRAAYNFSNAVARYQSMEGGYQAQESNDREEYRNQLQEQLQGNQFWTTRTLTDQNGKQITNENGEAYTEDEVRVITNPDGSRRFIIGVSGDQVAYIDEKGETGYMTTDELPGAMAETMPNLSEEQKQAIRDTDRTMKLDQFLEEELIVRRRELEAQRMHEEREEQKAGLRASHPIGAQVNIGTRVNPIAGTIIGYLPDAVTVQTNDKENPVKRISYEQLGQAFNTPIRVLTDEQIASEEAATIEAETAEKETENAITPQDMDSAEDSANSAAELEQEAAPSIVPTNEDGSVNEQKFLEENPEEYVAWNDAQRQDGGADSMEQLEMLIPVYQARYDESAKAWAANAADPVARRAAKDSMAEWQDKINRINNLLDKYRTPVQEQKPVAERTIQEELEDLHDGSFNDAEIASNIDAHIAEAQAAYDEYAKNAPVMGTDRSAYKKAKAEYEAGLKELEQELNYWNAVKAANETYGQVASAEEVARFRAEAVEAHRESLRQKARELEEKLGVKVNIIERYEDIRNKTAKAAIANGKVIYGWYNVDADTVEIYLPTNESADSIISTYVHEVVGHKGLRGLLGKNYDALLDSVYQWMEANLNEDQLDFWMNYENVNGDKRKAADEYLANLAENVNYEDNLTLWDKIVSKIKDILRRLGIEVNMDEKDFVNLIKRSYENLAEEAKRQGISKNSVAPETLENGTSLFSAKTYLEGGRTYLDEGIAHKGMREMLGEAKYGELCDKVWNEMMTEKQRKEFIKYPGVNGNTRAAADEFIASVSENVKQDTFWDKIANFFKDILNSIGIETKVADDDLKGLLKQSYQRYRRGEVSQQGGAFGKGSALKTSVEHLEKNGFDVDKKRGDVRFSSRHATQPQDVESIVNDIVRVTGRDKATAERWLQSEQSLTSMVLADKQYLDYVPDSKYSAIKSNSDYPQGTVDFNNICRKRLPFTQMYTRLQRRYPNRIFTADELADIRTIMSEDGLTVACGLCYVEDRRQMLGEVANAFINDLKDGFKTYAQGSGKKQEAAASLLVMIGSDNYVPTIYDLITLEGSDKLYEEHRGVWDAFGTYNRLRGQQTQNTFQGYAEYKREILGWSSAKVKKVNSLGGLRIFSYSDFEAHHLLDIVQIIIDCAAKGVMIQGYTKVPEFARAVARTGIKLNRSLIPLGDTGIVDGKLAYDMVEGIDINDPNFLEANDNVGNILIGINAEQIRLAMLDPFIDYIIPYHARQAGKIRAKLNVGAWQNYIDTQNERVKETGKRVSDNINIYTDILGPDVTNDREFVEKYLAKCEELGRIPKFDEFLDVDENGKYVYTPGYYKFLVDFKLFDKEGNILPQKPVIAEFDDAFNMQILNDYAEGERQTTGAQMNETYDKIVSALGLDESQAEGNDVMFKTRTDSQREKLFADAKAEFGLTDNFNVAGYMLPDGSLLNFGDPANPTTRAEDHRAIEGVIMDNGTEYDSRWMYLADFMNEGAIRLLPEYAGINLMKAPTKEQRQRLMDFIYKYNGEVILEIADERLNNAAYVEYDRRTSPARIFRDIDGYFNEGIVPQSNTMFKTANNNQAIFVSNAAKAVEGIKMEKATPEQWLKMLEKNGGLKAAEDKWLGLSDWLKSSDKKSITKEELLQFINENMIQIEEVHYGEEAQSKEALWNTIENSEQGRKAIEEQLEKDAKEFADEMMRGSSKSGDEWVKRHEELVREYLDEDFLGTNRNNAKRQVVKEWMKKMEVKPIHPTRQKYQTRGLTNNHEIALTVPTIESWEGPMPDVHFGDAGDGRAVAWIRFGDTKKLLGTTEVEGKKKFNWAKVLVIDEIQSNRHQEGRENGYRVSDIEQWLSDNNIEVVESGEFYEFIQNGEPDRRFSKGLMNYDIEKAKRLYVSGYNKSDIPDAPFDKNWHELAMKRMLRYAAENGYDVVAWTKGEQQAERYNLGKIYNEIEREDNPNIEGRTFSFSGGNYDKVTVNEDGVVVDSTIEEAKGKPLSDLVGKDLAIKMMSLENYDTIDGEDLRIGGEGMKGFYDKMLPAFMNKYGKKWGVKVEDMTFPGLEGGLTMHSIPVTEEMKQSVMEGQTMFKTKHPQEFTRQFMEGAVDNFYSTYNTAAPASVVYVKNRRMVEEALGFGKGEMPDWLYDRVKEEAKESGAYLVNIQHDKEDGTAESWRRILIFAKDDINMSADVDRIVFHENVHGFALDNPYWIELGKWLAETDNKTIQRVVGWIKDAYKKESWADEMLSDYVGRMLSIGKGQMALNLIPDEYKPILNEIYEKFGYNPEQEDGRRSAEVVRDAEELQMRNTELEGTSESGDTRFKSEITPEVRREMDVISAQAIVDGTYLKAPNGEDTKLTPDQWALVRTKNFIDWFGDWINDPENASKVVDENGEPKVVYHGGAWRPLLEEKGNAVFKMRGGMMGKGAYFTDNINTALYFAAEKYEMENNVENVSEGFLDENGYVAEVFLNIRDEKNIRTVLEDTYYLATSPNQIKSATDNTGEFSESEDIRFSTKEAVVANTVEDNLPLTRKGALNRLDALRKQASAANEDKLPYFVNDETGIKVFVSNADARHTMMYHNEDQVKVIGIYDKLISKARFVKFDEVDESEAETLEEVRKYACPVIIDGRQYVADMTIKKYRIGNYVLGETHLYDTKLKDDNSAPDASSPKELPILNSQLSSSESKGTNNSDTNNTSEENILFKTRTKPAPTKTQEVYKLMRLGADGRLYPLFIGSADAIELGVWYDADSPNLGDLTKLASGIHLVNNETGEAMTLDQFKAEHPEIAIKGEKPNVAAINWATENGMRWISIEDKATSQKRYEGESRSYYNFGINGSGQVGLFAMRPGWHAGSLPSMRQIGKGKDKNLRDDNFVWVRGRVPADINYQSEADANPDKDIPTHIPTDGFYMKATNANKKASQADKIGWYVAGSFIADEIISDAEAKRVIDNWNEQHPDAKVEYDFPRESGREFDPERGGLVEKEGSTLFKTTGTPTEEVIAKGLSLSSEESTNLAANIFKALPKDIRREVAENASRDNWDLKNATFQIVTSLAKKEELSDTEIVAAKTIADKVEDAILASGVEMTRPFTTNEGLWMLYNALNPANEIDPFAMAERAVVADRLGFSERARTNEKEDESEIRFRSYVPPIAVSAADAYTKAISYWGNRMNEAFVDQYDAVDHMMKAIEDATGKKAESWEDIRILLNQSASRGLARLKDVERDLIQKMWEAVNELAKAGATQDEISRYVILKHGLERNEIFAKRDAIRSYEEEYRSNIRRIKNDSTLTDAERKQQMDDAESTLNGHIDDVQNGVDEEYLKNREKDYSGVMAMFADYPGLKPADSYSTEEEYRTERRKRRKLKFDNLADAEEAAQKECDAFEKGRASLVDNLWDSIRNLSRGTLKMQYEYGMLGADLYNTLTQMFEYYVPLRGFADNTGEDLYDYYSHNVSDGYAPPVLSAKGRRTEAESPFGWMAAMAATAVVSGEKNLAKQALYYFAMNRKANDLLKIADVWYVESPSEKGKFYPEYPPKADPNNTPAENAQQYADWEQRMQELQEQGKAVKKTSKLDIEGVVHFDRKDAPEHIIKVNIAGEQKILILNANPRAAQAINGLLNIESNPDYQKVLGKVLRWMSQVSTGWNPEFWMTNITRDTITAFSAINIKEDQKYNEAFRRNWIDAWKVVKMLPKLKDGSLGTGRLEDLLREAVENGVQTGYSHIKSMEEWDKDMNKYLRDLNKDEAKAVRGVKNFIDGVQTFSEAMELVSRFATYITSREQGRSITEAVADAKEVTVNFNRKGSGMCITFEEAKKLKWADGTPIFSEKWKGAKRFKGKLSVAYVSGISALSPFGRKYMMFFNAAVQGLNMWLQMIRKGYGKQVSALAGASFALGILNAVIQGMLDGDDDDYQQSISDYERRSNLMLGANGYYLKIALPQEIKAFYGLGDILYNYMAGNYHHKDSPMEIVKTMGNQLFEMLPINPLGGWSEFIPSMAKGVVEAGVAVPFFGEVIKGTNKDFAGVPIREEMPWLNEQERESLPKYTFAMEDTWSWLVGIAELANRATGGTEYDAGWLQLDPARIQHYIEQGTGGVGRFVGNILSTANAAIDPETDVQISNVPFLGKVLTVADERSQNKLTNQQYYYYKGVAERSETRYDRYISDRDREAAKRERESDDFKILRVYKQYEARQESYRERLKRARTKEEEKELKKKRDANRKEFLDKLGNKGLL